MEACSLSIFLLLTSSALPLKTVDLSKLARREPNRKSGFISVSPELPARTRRKNSSRRKKGSFPSLRICCRENNTTAFSVEKREFLQPTAETLFFNLIKPLPFQSNSATPEKAPVPGLPHHILAESMSYLLYPGKTV